MSRRKKFITYGKIHANARRGTIRRHAKTGSTSKIQPPNRAAVAAFNHSKRSRIVVDEWDKRKRPWLPLKTRTLYKGPAQ